MYAKKFGLSETHAVQTTPAPPEPGHTQDPHLVRTLCDTFPAFQESRNVGKLMVNWPRAANVNKDRNSKLCEEVDSREERAVFWNSGDLRFSEFVYYESMKRDLKTRPIYECRCDERLKTKAEESTDLAYTGLLGELQHLKIETRLIDEMFASVMGEYVFLKW